MQTYDNEFIKIYLLAEAFLQARSYNQCVELISSALAPLLYFPTYHQGNHTRMYYVDATKLPLCHPLREKSQSIRWFSKKKQEKYRFLGLKRHLLINHVGEIISIRVARGNTDDRTPLPDMCKGLTELILVMQTMGQKQKLTHLLNRNLS